MPRDNPGTRKADQEQSLKVRRDNVYTLIRTWHTALYRQNVDSCVRKIQNTLDKGVQKQGTSRFMCSRTLSASRINNAQQVEHILPQGI